MANILRGTPRSSLGPPQLRPLRCGRQGGGRESCRPVITLQLQRRRRRSSRCALFSSAVQAVQASASSSASRTRSPTPPWRRPNKAEAGGQPSSCNQDAARVDASLRRPSVDASAERLWEPRIGAAKRAKTEWVGVSSVDVDPYIVSRWRDERGGCGSMA